MQMHPSLHLLLGAVFLLSGSAHAQSLIVNAARDRLSCRADAPAGVPVTLYVLAMPHWFNGIAGVELRIEGLPPEWWATATPNPAANYTTGDPLAAAGAQIAFGDCAVADAGGAVLLYTLEVMHQGDTAMHELLVRGRMNPSDPRFACAFLVLCDAPVYTRLCVSTAPFYLNTAPGQTANPARLLQPEDGAQDVPRNPTLVWQSARNRDCFNHPFPPQCIRLGTDPNPTQVACDNGASWSAFHPELLQPFTTYYWRIETSSSVTSPTWSFTTGNTVAVNTPSWSVVKDLFR